VVLADDDVLLREGLAGLLARSGFDVVGQCGTGAELIALVREHRPDLAIVDIRMPPTHTSEGLDAASSIREEFPDEQTRKEAAGKYFDQIFGDQLAKMHQKDEQQAERAKRIARMFRFLCPSYYIPGKQEWGAF